MARIKRICLGLVILSGGLAFFYYHEDRRGCAKMQKTFTMDDGELPGVLAQGERFDVDLNWYSCHGPQQGDTVLFQVAKQMPPKTKIVRAIAGDRFDVRQNQAKDHWNIFVNDRMVLDFQGQPYSFGGASSPTLALFKDARKGRMREGEVMLLSTRSFGNNDSGTMGVFSMRDVLGRVILKERQK